MDLEREMNMLDSITGIAGLMLMALILLVRFEMMDSLLAIAVGIPLGGVFILSTKRRDVLYTKWISD